ncbi:hypothetical protein ACR75P_08355 [Faecalicoccus pleomorphus]|uniref:hypothetical protein n=1 Tax=Faecalicoccus pleomorphus TaxID=1323 RepID=UPI003DA3B582
MTEEKLERANSIKSEINECERALRNDIKGVFYTEKDLYMPSREYINISLDVEVNEKIKDIIRERLEELKKEFEEL